MAWPVRWPVWPGTCWGPPPRCTSASPQSGRRFGWPPPRRSVTRGGVPTRPRRETPRPATSAQQAACTAGRPPSPGGLLRRSAGGLPGGRSGPDTFGGPASTASPTARRMSEPRRRRRQPPRGHLPRRPPPVVPGVPGGGPALPIRRRRPCRHAGSAFPIPVGVFGQPSGGSSRSTVRSPGFNPRAT